MDSQPAAEITDAELLLRVAKQDRLAFSALYDRLSKVLFTIAVRILNNESEAEDVLQDVFVQLWHRAAEFNPELGRPLSWAVTLTRNKAIDRLRSSRRRLQLVEAAAKTDFLLVQALPDSESAVEMNEEALTIRSALGQLSSEQRQAIELAFFTGLTQAEIAETLHEPLGTIKARIRRGMLKLRETLEST